MLHQMTRAAPTHDRQLTLLRMSRPIDYKTRHPLLTSVAGFAAALLTTGVTQAQELRLPAQATIGYESVRLPGGERMGLLGISELVQPAPGWWLGPAIYGAASGERGGLFTWGAEVQRRWPLHPQLTLAAGLYVGAGGGAAAPVGGGLMLRPHAELLWSFGGWSAGLGASNVRFPSGNISSSQLSLLVSSDHSASYAIPGHGIGVGRGVGVTRGGVTVQHYAQANAKGAMKTVGTRAAWRLNPSLEATLDVHGASGGGADGYAEIDAGLLALWPVVPRHLGLGVHAHLGLGGGGAVPTGGGTLAKLSAVGSMAVGHWTLSLESGRARAFDGAFNSRFTQVTVDTSFGESNAPLRDTSFGLTVQQWPRAQRKDKSQEGIGLLGFKLRRQFGDPWYFAAQAHSAATGSAGAFSIGLVGAGAAWRPAAAPQWRLGAEMMAGAAGGGGIDNGGGALGQVMAWAGRDLGTHSRVELGVGYVKSFRGKLDTPLVELAWTVDFGLR